MSDGYADLLRQLLPGAVVDICYPADPGANLPIGGLEGYDGVAITGSALNVYDGGPAIEPQIELAREVLKSKTPLFGSCWGLQVITVAAGGMVRPNPKGRELGIGRRIALTPAGRDHPMYRRQGVGVRRRHGASRRGRDRSRPAPPCWRRTRIPTCRRPRSGSTARSPGACSIIRSSRSPTWRRSCAATDARLMQRGLLRRRGGARRLCGGPRRRSTATPDNKPLAWRYGIDETRARSGASAPPRSPTGSRIRCCRRVPGADGG